MLHLGVYFLRNVLCVLSDRLQSTECISDSHINLQRDDLQPDRRLHVQ